MCSMWLPAVLGEITRRAAISLLDESAGDQAEYLDLACGQTRPVLRGVARIAVTGCGEHRLDGVGFEATCSHVGAEFGCRAGR